MNINYDATVILVKDIALMRHFYLNVLNQKLTDDFGICITLDGRINLLQLENNHIIAKNRGGTFDPNGNNNLEICFTTDNIAEVNELLQKEKVTFCHPLKEEQWGQKIMRIYDPERNLIEIAETLNAFLHRMVFDERLSYEKISQKTGLPIEAIKISLKEK